MTRVPWLATLGLMACGQARPEPVDYGKTPVVLVHGLGESGAIWSSVERELVRRGYPAEYVIALSLEPSGGANGPAAEQQLAPAVTRVLAVADSLARAHAAAPPSKVDLVAHSMGSLSARYYALLVPERVRSLVTLAGANHGSDRFCPPADPPGAAEMCPAYATADGGIQARLNGTPALPVDETPWGVGTDGARPSTAPDSARRIRYATLSAGTEAWIVPDSSTYLHGAGGWREASRPEGVREVSPGRFMVNGADHDNIVSRRAAVELLAALLTEGF